MRIRGWVYVLSNKAMPGLFKIGYSTKDPVLRADELQGTGLPHPFVVAYDVLVEEPREVEQQVHFELKECHEAKEFFRIRLREAIETLREVIEQQEKIILLENIPEPEPGSEPEPEEAVYRCSSLHGCFDLVSTPGGLCPFHKGK